MSLYHTHKLRALLALALTLVMLCGGMTAAAAGAGDISAEEQAAFESAAGELFESYIAYCAKGGVSDMYNVLNRASYNSELYKYVSESAEGMLYCSPTDYEFTSLEYTGFEKQGDDGFTCLARYTADCTAVNWNESYSYTISNELKLSFRLENTVWKAFDITDTRSSCAESFDSLLDGSDLQLIDIADGRCKGKLLYVKDPSRVSVGSIDKPGWEAGMILPELVEKCGGTAGINAGGYNDENGRGNGGIPVGVIIQDGKVNYGSEWLYTDIIGLDGGGKLILGKMTVRDAVENGVISGVSFATHDGRGSALMTDGEIQTANIGPGVNPRTALAQRADGSLLLLVLDGRCIDTLGVRTADMCSLLQWAGAVDIANLDGGASSCMVVDGEIVNNCSSCTGPRRIPTAFIVR